MSFSEEEEEEENMKSFNDQLEMLQNDLVMARTLIRKDLTSAKGVLSKMKERIEYTLENY